MPQQDVQDAIKQAKLDMAPKNGSVSTTGDQGKQVFASIEANTKLTGPERQEVYRQLAKEYTTEAMKSGGGKTLMRQNDAGSGLITAYMNTYASEFTDAMRHTAIQETAKTKVPKFMQQEGMTFGMGVGLINGPDGGRLADDSPQRKEVDAVTTDLAKRINTAGMKNLSQLSDDARLFMQAVLEPTANNPDARNQAAANILFLRAVNSSINDDAASIKSDKNLTPEGALMGFANIVNQTYHNTVSQPPGQIKHNDNAAKKPADDLASQFRDQATLDLSREGFEALAKGGQDFENFLNKVGPPDDYSNSSKNVQTKASNMVVSASKGTAYGRQKNLKKDVIANEDGISDGLDRITKLQARMERINAGKMNFGDKVGAFFAGGKTSYKANTAQEIQSNIQDIGDYLKKNPGTRLDKITAKLGERVEALEAVKDSLFKNGAEAFALSGTDQQNMPQQKKISDQYTKTSVKVEKVKQRMDVVESVREKLGIEKPKPRVNIADKLDQEGAFNQKTPVNSPSPTSSPKTNTTTSIGDNVSDVGITELSKGNMQVQPPKQKPEVGIKALAKGEHINEEDPNKKLTQTVGKELEGALQGRKQGGPKQSHGVS